MNPRALLFVFFWAFSLTASLTSVAHAQRFQGPIATAMGGAGRAAVDPLESFFLNPATLAFLPPLFALGGHYQNGDHPRDGRSRTLGAVFSDGSPDKIIPGSLSFLRSTNKSPAGLETNENEYRVSIGGFIYPGISLGAGGHYREIDFVRGPDYFQSNVDLGMMFAPVERFAMSLVAYNALSADTKTPEGFRDVPTLAVGFHGIYEDAFHGRLDFVRPDKLNPRRRIDVQAGIESVFVSGFAFRFGCNWKESANKTLLGAGIGFKGPRLQFDYAFEQDVRADGAFRHLVDLWLPF